MKEVTYEEWQKNPTPRMMWVWDDDIESMEKKNVVYITNRRVTYPVFTDDATFFKHCAEIEEPKTRRMTHKELSRWLRENPTREFVYSKDGELIFCYHTYPEDEASKEVPDSILIREDDGEWREPLVEVEE